ncbi:HPr(Ser) kinase/phosphatase [Hominenteromicrobium sp.]|uniref:HPr(Ser) kinase/phosphatase n=1 Tax=Hominenteromicrobium sp. TaxID=3073581 RepID=UPI003AF0E229
MPEVYTIPLSKIIHELQLETAFLPKSADDILIQSRDVVRPGMELNGYHEYFDPNRIAVLGRAEMYMLESLKPERRAMALDSYLSLKPPAVIVARGIDPGKDFMEIAETYHVPVLHTTESTSNVVASLVAYLNVELAPRITRHGVLVEVYGEGILLVGDSGVGKSETAIELIKRGHRLIADDAVEIRRVSSKSLVGQSPENIRHFIELRGIGIINARRIFGMGAVKLQEKIDMCINLEIWDATKVYDRMGMDSEYTEILGIKVPVMTIPVKPGRNLAIIIEVAAMNNRQKKMGYNAAYELLSTLGMDASMMPHEEIKRDLDI